MATSIDTWAYYKGQLASPSPIDDMHNRENDPKLISGFWRILAARTKIDWPVMIWFEPDVEKNPTGATIFQIGGNRMRTDTHPTEWQGFLEKSWLKCIAVQRADYVTATTVPAPGTSDGTLGRWPDGKPARKMTVDELLNITIPTAGDNQAPLDELYAEQIKTLADKMEALEVTDQDSADFASGMDDAMRRLIQLATVEFEAEKAPVLEAGRKVDGKWRVARSPGEEARKTIIARRDAWLRGEQRRQQAITDAANKAAREAEEAAKEAARAAVVKQAEQAGITVDEEEIAARVAEVVPPAQEVAAPKVSAGSATGRSTSVKKVPVAPVTDIIRLVQHMIDTNDIAFVAFVQEKARKAQRAKITLPGVEFFADQADWLIEKAKREAAKPGVPAEFEEAK